MSYTFRRVASVLVLFTLIRVQALALLEAHMLQKLTVTHGPVAEFGGLKLQDIPVS